MSNQPSSHITTRAVAVLMACLAVVIGLPALLLAVAVQRFGHPSPVYGMKAPWHWSSGDLHSWGRRLTKGLDSSSELVDLFVRVALIIGWVCVAILIFTVIDELVFQLRHGMPSGRHRRTGGLGAIGRSLASALVAVLPLSMSTGTPALASAATRPAAVVVQHDAADRDDPLLPAPAATAPDSTTPLDQSSGWSLVEVQHGDSVWAIAQRVADGRDVNLVAQQIVSANVGTVMSDGHRFSTPALIEPGWLLNVPTSVGSAVPSPIVVPTSSERYVVEPGDSFWEIAERRLGQSATGHDIAAYTEQLIAINGPLLGHSDARLIRPGDVVQLAAPVVAPSVTTAAPTEVDVPTPVAVPGPVSSLPEEALSTSAESAPIAQLPPPTLPAAVPQASVVEPSPPVVAEHRADDNLATGSGLGAAVVLAGGVIAALAARRRQQLRGADFGARLVPPTRQAVETETVLRSLNDADRLARIDLALRCAAPDLAGQLARPLAVEISDDGEIRVYPDRPAMVVSERWKLDIESGAWRLPAEVSLVDLADDARRANQPCPAIVHLGESAGGQLFVDLEAVGSLSIDAPPVVAASIVRCATASLAVSPFAEASRVFTVGLGTETQLGSPNVEALESLGEAIGTLRATVGSTAAATSADVTTFALRAAHGGEAWEPSLLLTVGADDPDELAALVSLAGTGGRGIGVMIDRHVRGAGVVLRADEHDFVLEPLGRRVNPVGLSVAEVSAVDELLDLAERPLPVEPAPVIWAPPSVTGHFCDQAHELVVRVLGQVTVQSTMGVSVAFDRSKAQELVVWLSQHRLRPTRVSARTALWDLAVRDATFSNVVSDARRAMARLVAPPAGQEWIGRTMNEDLPLHDLVVSDAELLAARIAAARGLDDLAAIAVLRPGVALIEGMPFAGTSYLWPDAEGITSALVLLAITAAGELANHYLSIDDVDGVFWSTGQGLKVLAGHEELIALRMRAHARRGDLSGVRHEWESYERAVNADSWSAAEPSPKLVELRRELLSPSMAS
jgi:nucleoid-associated protein YgaU